MEVGAIYKDEGSCRFVLWAPLLKKVELELIEPSPRVIPMERGEEGYWELELDGIKPGTKYMYILNGKDKRPDPASRSQPLGVHGPSAVVDYCHPSSSAERWKGLDLKEYIIYELHIGTFTEKGDFEAIEHRLDYLRELGVTAIELMPIAQFPGDCNWGYDGVFPYAAQSSYGGPWALKRLVNICHQAGMAVILDVVYNHLGPEGNYLAGYGPYFSSHYRTPWGKAVNFDGPYSDGVRNYFLQNALYWLRYYDIDALRVDAVSDIYDMGARHFLEELNDSVKELSAELGKAKYLIAESDLNDPKFIREPAQGGYGFSSQWNDDFHHALHACLTGENNSFYADHGPLANLVKSYKKAFYFTGEYCQFRKKKFGRPADGMPAEKFVVYSQNHDMIGNRMGGERLSHLVSWEAAKMAAALTILSPYLPMLFMGEEFASSSPFYFFVSFDDEHLVEAVRKGRKREFKEQGHKGDPIDPADLKTFYCSKLDYKELESERGEAMFELYKKLLKLRRSEAVLKERDRERLECSEERPGLLVIKRWNADETILMAANFNKEPVELGLDASGYTLLLDTADSRYLGSGLGEKPGDRGYTVRAESYVVLKNSK